MKRLVWIIISIVIGIYIFGSINCDSKKEKNLSNQTADYLPLTVGNKWVYRVTSHGGMGRKEGKTDEVIYAVTRTQQYKGEDCFVIEAQREGPNPQPIFYKVIPKGIISYHGIRGGEAIDFDSPFVDIKNPLKMGETWTGKGKIDTLDFEFSTTFTKEEEIITPAGQFTCIKLERTEGGAKYIYWYSKNVGLVKMVSGAVGAPRFGIPAGEDIEELTSFQVN